MRDAVASYFINFSKPLFAPQPMQTEKIIDAAIAAPSAGNNQPWKFVYDSGVLFLFHDKARSWSWGDYFEMGSHMSLGACIENIHLEAAKNKLEDEVQLFPLAENPFLIAAIRFSESQNGIAAIERELSNHIFSRHTNRMLGVRKPIESDFFDALKEVVNANDIKLYHSENANDLEELGEIIATCDKIRLLNQQGHEEFFSEVRWDENHAKQTGDGIDIHAVDVTIGEIAAFKMAADWEPVSMLSKWKQGNAFKKMSKKSLASASSIIVFTVSELNHKNLIKVGRMVERVWLMADKYQVAVHPMLSSAFFFNRLLHGKKVGLSQDDVAELQQMRAKFLNVFPIRENEHEVFLMKLSKAEDNGVRACRLNKNKLFITTNNITEC
jgi:hypothetical protein